LRLSRYILFVIIAIAAATSCKEEEKPKPVIKKVVKKVRKTGPCTLDSALVLQILDEHNASRTIRTGILSFYTQRKFVGAWVSELGVNEFAGSFINILNNEEILIADSVTRALKPDHLYRDVVSNKNLTCSDSVIPRLEVLLTLNFFQYASRNWGGVNQEISKRAGWFIARKEVNYEKLLNDFLTNKNQFRVNEPVFRQYILLKQFLRKYNYVAENHQWPTLPATLKIKPGKKSDAMPAIKQILYLTEDLAKPDSSNLYDEVTVVAVKNFQRRHGLAEDGKIEAKTLAALKIPARERVQQILINMERSRWVPTEVKGDYILVNIPQFRMFVYENNELQWSCNVVVGKSNPVNETVVFNDSIEFVVFSPYWHIPKNILFNEIIPSVKADPTYLERNNMEIVTNKGKPITGDINWDLYTEHFPYIVRERPGRANSLGLVKFLFPNPFEIYLHDTPSKSLFSRPSRAFSHGCVRVEKPLQLAKFLLRDDTTWTDEKLEEVTTSGEEMFVRLKKKVPVFIAYFTSWVDSAGQVNFREDVYGHDTTMKQLLFVN
jgi:murein L,D-transpeptidase YcbB/YkuD